MQERAKRIAKGIHMGLGFILFFLGIMAVLLLVTPVYWALDRRGPPEPARMQKIHSRLFSAWLAYLKMGGLLEALEPKGEPYEGTCVIVGNHPGLFDVLYLIRDIPRMSVMVKRALVTKLPLGPIFKRAGYVVTRGRLGGDTLEPLMNALEVLEAGYKLQIFPEGTRSPKGKLGTFRSGAFKIARLAGAPVQPVFIYNEPPFLGHEDKWYFPPADVSRLRLEYWEPLPPPASGEEAAMAAELEERFRQALNPSPQALAGRRAAV